MPYTYYPGGRGVTISGLCWKLLSPVRNYPRLVGIVEVISDCVGIEKGKIFDIITRFSFITFSAYSFSYKKCKLWLFMNHLYNKISVRKRYNLVSLCPLKKHTFSQLKCHKTYTRKLLTLYNEIF